MRELPHLEKHILDCTNIEVYDKEILSSIQEEIDKANSMIDHGRDFDFTYAGLRQVVDKYLVQDRSGGGVYETPQFMYIMIALTIFQEYPKDTPCHTSRGIMTQSPNTNSTFPHLSWQECELHFDNLLAVFLLMLMTPR